MPQSQDLHEELQGHQQLALAQVGAPWPNWGYVLRIEDLLDGIGWNTQTALLL